MTRNARQRLAIMRIAMGSYAVIWTLVRAANIIDTVQQPARRFDPVGPLWFLNDPLPVGVTVAAVAIVVVAGAALVLGWQYRITAPATAVAFLFVSTYRNSWGHIIHTENLLSMQLVVLAIAPAATVWALDARDRSTDTDDASAFDDGWWAVKSMAVLAVGAYFVAGVAKLRISGMHWLDGDVLLHQISFDNARKIEIGAPASPLASSFVSQHWLMAPAALGALLIELGAPIALIRERLAMIWVTLAVLMHFGILAIMYILFPYQLLVIAMFPLLPVEVLVVKGLRRRGDPRTATATLPSTVEPELQR